MRIPLLLRGSRKPGYRPSALSYREPFLQAADGLLGWADAAGILRWLDMGNSATYADVAGALTGGGSARTLVECDGTSWTSH